MAHSANKIIAHSSRQSRSVSLHARLMTFLALARQRRQLSALDQHLLNDIGVSRTQAENEAQKSGWDVPQRWYY
ncbi:DUF1127 domain-containing protein [Yoonia sp.]|uniref:DUF1127 domain-containing protein n=1 Tax=Yoonia sp. TaxID=2212373 RepID=UPI0023B4EFDC